MKMSCIFFVALALLVPGGLVFGVAGEKGGKMLRVCLISGAAEYKSDQSLAKFQDYLENNHPVVCTRAFARSETDLPGLENLDRCDVALLFTRRLKLEGEQLE